MPCASAFPGQSGFAGTYAKRSPSSSADRLCILCRIAEFVRRNKLLIECRKIGDPLRVAEIDQQSAVLPDIVMIVAIVATAMNEERMSLRKKSSAGSAVWSVSS